MNIEESINIKAVVTKFVFLLKCLPRKLTDLYKKKLTTLN